MSHRSRPAARGLDEFLFSWSTCLWGKEDGNCRLSWVYNFTWQLKGFTERSWHGVRHTACKVSPGVTCRAHDNGAGVTRSCWPRIMNFSWESSFSSLCPKLESHGNFSHHCFQRMESSINLEGSPTSNSTSLQWISPSFCRGYSFCAYIFIHSRFPWDLVEDCISFSMAPEDPTTGPQN